MKFIRKTAAFLIISAMLCISAAVSASAATNTIRGDANKDGIVSISDVTAIQKYLASIPETPFNAKAADVNGDGVAISDATAIQRYIMGCDNEFKIGQRMNIDQDPYELPFIPC